MIEGPASLEEARAERGMDKKKFCCSGSSEQCFIYSEVKKKKKKIGEHRRPFGKAGSWCLKGHDSLALSQFHAHSRESAGDFAEALLLCESCSRALQCLDRFCC